MIRNEKLSVTVWPTNCSQCDCWSRCSFQLDATARLGPTCCAPLAHHLPFASGSFKWPTGDNSSISYDITTRMCGIPARWLWKAPPRPTHGCHLCKAASARSAARSIAQTFHCSRRSIARTPRQHMLRNVRASRGGAPAVLLFELGTVSASPSALAGCLLCRERRRHAAACPRGLGRSKPSGPLASCRRNPCMAAGGAGALARKPGGFRLPGFLCKSPPASSGVTASAPAGMPMGRSWVRRPNLSPAYADMGASKPRASVTRAAQRCQARMAPASSSGSSSSGSYRTS